MKFFATEFREGMPISVRGFARGLMAMARALGEMDGIGCHIEWSGLGIPKIVVDQPTDEDESSQSTPETDNRSIEVSSEEKLQLVRFDDSDVTDKGFAELVKISDDKLSPISDAQKYEMVVRVKGESGGVIGYMPFGAGDGEGDKDAPENAGAECDQNDHPGDEDYSDDNGVMGGGFYRAYGYDFRWYEGDDRDDADDAPDPDRHPAKDDCYSTAA